MECVYCAVRNGYSNILKVNFRLKRVKQQTLSHLRSFGILHSVERQFLTDVSGQATAHIFKSQTVYSWTDWPLKMIPAGWPKTSVRNCHSTLRKIPEEGRSHTAAEDRNHAKILYFYYYYYYYCY